MAVETENLTGRIGDVGVGAEGGVLDECFCFLVEGERFLVEGQFAAREAVLRCRGHLERAGREEGEVD